MTRDPTLSAPRSLEILLVVSAHDVRRALQLRLRGHGLDVRAYGSGAALLADPRAGSAAGLVADDRAGGGNGFDVLKGLRDRSWTGPALLITETLSAELALRAREAGFSQVLDKGALDRTLVEAVDRMLQSARPSAV